METKVLRIGSVRALLAAETISTSGAQMTWVALPWFVLTTTGSATRMSVVIAVEAIGIALAGFLGIRVLNRLGARRTMLLCDACRGPLMLVIPLCHWAGALSFGLIAAVAFAVGAFTAPHFAAQRVIVPELVGEDEGVVSQASALFQGANRVTLLLGPPLAGVLIGLISAPAVLVVDAATYAVSVFLLGVFVPATKPLPAVGEEDRGFRAGLRWAGRDPLFRAWRISLIVGDMAWQAIFISLPVLVVTRYDADPRIVGAMFAAFGVGAVLGNTVAYRLVKRLDGLTLIARVALGQALPLWLLVFEVPAWAAIGVLGASGLANGLINPSLHAIITLRIPPELRATVISSFMTVFALAMPIGILGAGPLLDLLGVTPVFAICAAIQTVVMALVALAALRARGQSAERRPAWTVWRRPRRLHTVPADGASASRQRRASTCCRCFRTWLFATLIDRPLWQTGASGLPSGGHRLSDDDRADVGSAAPVSRVVASPDVEPPAADRERRALRPCGAFLSVLARIGLGAGFAGRLVGEAVDAAPIVGCARPADPNGLQRRRADSRCARGSEASGSWGRWDRGGTARCAACRSSCRRCRQRVGGSRPSERSMARSRSRGRAPRRPSTGRARSTGRPVLERVTVDSAHCIRRAVPADEDTRVAAPRARRVTRAELRRSARGRRVDHERSQVDGALE